MKAIRVFLVLLAGCASQIQSVPKNWDHASDPGCTENYDLVVADGAIAALGTGGGLAVAGLVESRTHDRSAAGAVAIGGLAIGVVFALSAASGYDKVEECQRLTEGWRTARATARREVGAARGFFCAISPTRAGLCTRERSVCEQARDLATAAVPDLGACKFLEVAWCFARGGGRGDLCAPTRGGCAAQFARSGDTECEERR